MLTVGALMGAVIKFDSHVNLASFAVNQAEVDSFKANTILQGCCGIISLNSLVALKLCFCTPNQDVTRRRDVGEGLENIMFRSAMEQVPCEIIKKKGIC